MAFTYDLAATGDDLTVSSIRLEIGDTIDATNPSSAGYVEDGGAKPDGKNFSDAELLKFYSDKGSVNLAAAKACQVLATMWAGGGERVNLRGYSIDTTKKADQYREMARDLRKHKFMIGVT